MRKYVLAVLSLVLISGIACSPKVYVMDRHTIMEDEAAGEWPEVEKELLNQNKSAGPEMFGKTAFSEKKQRLYKVLNGEAHE